MVTQPSDQPVIVGFVADLMFQMKIQNVAERLGYEMVWVEKAADMGMIAPDDPAEQPGELLHGQGGRLFAQLTRWQPDLLIFDLANPAIPWRLWIPALKSSPATRRLPILAYAPHVEVETIKAAEARGADGVVPRSRFSRALPQLIEKYVRTDQSEALQSACAEPLAALGQEGIELFNQGKYYKAHDPLEEAWFADEGAGREIYRAILQVGIAYFQIERGNYRGAVKMLLRVRQWLAPLPDICRGVDIARLREDVDNVHDALVALGPEEIDRLDRSLFRPVRVIN
ncbi:MAG: DUF309 domain-containing protein [Candidatus Promineifilaceae bacterium]|nr:DUF309 domain-containing protein [Candidatus Promineifilaceae bacterium]